MNKYCLRTVAINLLLYCTLRAMQFPNLSEISNTITPEQKLKYEAAFVARQKCMEPARRQYEALMNIYREQRVKQNRPGEYDLELRIPSCAIRELNHAYEICKQQTQAK